MAEELYSSPDGNLWISNSGASSFSPGSTSASRSSSESPYWKIQWGFMVETTEAEKRISVLMGDDVGPRREWIDTHVSFTLEDDYMISRQEGEE